MSTIQALRGMSDLLPAESVGWQYLESRVSECLHAYGYREIRVPLLEKTDLFARSIGEVTDIVEKEMYTFADRSGDSITLRPEGTASVVRACQQHGLLYHQTQRLWYAGPMFRYERPQKGRLRQFHQIGAEVFGMAGPAIDAELLLMTARLWKMLGVDNAVSLHINALGNDAARAAYRQALVDYLTRVYSDLDEDSQQRLQTNPLRILDSKIPATQALLDRAPALSDYLDDDSRQQLQKLQQILDAAGVAYTLNPRLVRGLDYYTGTVFEWVTDKLGAQGAVCAGGRYDGLVAQLGGKATPAVGFAMGVERLMLLLHTLDVLPAALAHRMTPRVYILVIGDVAPYALSVAESIRNRCPGVLCQVHCSAGSFKSQMKKADKSGAEFALIIGEDEMAGQQLVLKYLRAEKAQQDLTLDQALHFFAGLDRPSTD
ncbi:MAG: histidine--tRNA ligase [Cellvibrionaceae bacterium]|nr:histidine--tRNA ligase [Cellvibrionaceae bacterium]